MGGVLMSRSLFSVYYLICFFISNRFRKISIILNDSKEKNHGNECSCDFTHCADRRRPLLLAGFIDWELGTKEKDKICERT